MMTNCLKLAKRRKLEEDPDEEKCQVCNTATLVLEWKTPTQVDPNRSPKESHRDVQASKKTKRTKTRTIRTNFFEGFKLKPPRPKNQHSHMSDTKPLDNWQRQVDTINIQLKQLTTEPDLLPQKTTTNSNQSLNMNSSGRLPTTISQTPYKQICHRQTTYPKITTQKPFHAMTKNNLFYMKTFLTTYSFTTYRQ